MPHELDPLVRDEPASRRDQRVLSAERAKRGFRLKRRRRSGHACRLPGTAPGRRSCLGASRPKPLRRQSCGSRLDSSGERASRSAAPARWIRHEAPIGRKDANVRGHRDRRDARGRHERDGASARLAAAVRQCRHVRGACGARGPAALKESRRQATSRTGRAGSPPCIRQGQAGVGVSRYRFPAQGGTEEAGGGRETTTGGPEGAPEGAAPRHGDDVPGGVEEGAPGGEGEREHHGGSGRRAPTGSEFGRGDPGDEGVEEGHLRKEGGAPGGTDPNARHGAEGGRKGGTGQPGDQGVVGALAWFPLIRVPSDVAPLVEVAIIAADAGLLDAAFAKLMAKTLTRAACARNSKLRPRAPRSKSSKTSGEPCPKRSSQGPAARAAGSRRRREARSALRGDRRPCARRAPTTRGGDKGGTRQRCDARPPRNAGSASP